MQSKITNVDHFSILLNLNKELVKLGSKYKNTRHGDNFRNLVKKQLDFISANKDINYKENKFNSIDNLYELDKLKDETRNLYEKLQHDREIVDYYQKLEIYVSDIFYDHIRCSV